MDEEIHEETLTSTIVDESNDDERRFQLYVGDTRQALVVKKPGRPVEINWQIYGPQFWPPAKVLLQGLLDLSVIADQLAGEKHVERKPRKR